MGMDIVDAVQILNESSDLLDSTVARLEGADWLRSTPAEGWTVADQIGHLTWTDEISLQALTDPVAFQRLAEEVASAADAGFVDRGAHELAALPAADLLARWRRARRELSEGLLAADPGGKIPWFGPPMRPITMATARTMETWAHSLDVFDTFGIEFPETSALWAVARIGVRTRDFAFRLRSLAAPGDVRVELDMPGGERFEDGPEDAPDRVVGSGWGFAAVVTQRRNLADVDLAAVGDGASTWMGVAQAFAGAPTAGPAPGERLA